MAEREKKQLTAQEQLDMDLLAEAELARLQRQYRIMEGDRKAFSEESGGKLRKYKNVLKTLKDEERNILLDLKVANSIANKRKDAKVRQTLNLMLGEHDQFDLEIKIEKAHLEEIDYQIKKVQKEVLKYRAAQVTDEQCQERELAGQRIVAALENRLETATKKFNTVLIDNQKLREEIDHMLKERTHFNQLWEKLINNLNTGKKFMLDLIEQATLAYDQREEWVSKLQALRQKGAKDLQMHTQEMKNLQRQLDHDAKLQEFLGIKGQKRVMADIEEREAKKRQETREKMEKQLIEYKQILEKITEFTEEDDIEKLSQQFLKQEEENFALFNYINELNHELENLSDTIATLKRKIDHQRHLNETRQSKQQDTIADLDELFDLKSAQSERLDNKLRDLDTKLNIVMKGIEKIFSYLQCDNAPILALLGEKTVVNIYNVVLYLSLIEGRVTELLQNVYHKEKTNPDKSRRTKAGNVIIADPKVRHVLYTIDKICATQPCALCVEQEQVSDIYEEDVTHVPLDRAEIERKLKIRLEKPDAFERLHNVSACHLPKSRRIMQRRYQ